MCESRVYDGMARAGQVNWQRLRFLCSLAAGVPSIWKVKWLLARRALLVGQLQGDAENSSSRVPRASRRGHSQPRVSRPCLNWAIRALTFARRSRPSAESATLTAAWAAAGPGRTPRAPQTPSGWRACSARPVSPRAAAPAAARATAQLGRTLRAPPPLSGWRDRTARLASPPAAAAANHITDSSGIVQSHR